MCRRRRTRNGNGSERRKKKRTRTGSKRRGKGLIQGGVQGRDPGLAVGQQNVRKTIGTTGKTSERLGVGPNPRRATGQNSTKPTMGTAVLTILERRIVSIKMLKLTKLKKITPSPTANGKT